MQQHDKNLKKEVFLTDAEAFAYLSRKTQDKTVIRVGSFGEFIKNIWSKSYEHPEWFGLWHIQLICEDIEKAIQDKKNYCAVLPRYHLKSTILGHGFSVWALLRSANPKYESTGIYLSNTLPLAQYHIREIKRAINRNEQLKEWMEDKVPDSEMSFRYIINGSSADIQAAGIMSFERGRHVNRFGVCDDLLRDPANPGNLSQLSKIEDTFQKEFVHIPVRPAPIILLGTPMAPNDLLTKTKDDESFIYRFLPALDPMPGHRVLCPEIRTEEELLQMKKSQKESFASEMMLQPYISVNGYITDEELQEVENSQLRSLHSEQDIKFDTDYVVAGVDVGKKRHPSHVSIYASKSGKLVQIYQEFMDGWEYVKQAYHLNELAKDFNITKGYYDNTDRSLEERGMNAVWQPLAFNNKNKHDMARIFSSYISNKKIEMIQDERQRSQITSVDISLNAITTPLGHGDAFWSNALALIAFDEMQNKNTISIGNMQDFVKAGDNPLRKDGLNFPNANNISSEGACPKCGESLGWIAERKLCLICSERF